MKVLVLGASGQVGRELQRALPPGVQIDAVDRATLDLAAPQLRERILARAPRAIINVAAYTGVDRAESEPGLAHAINATAPGAIAAAARELDARLVHVSTDFVFDGNASRPYAPESACAPLGVYGHSKREGELRVLAQCGAGAVVLRTSWVYASHGSNFVLTMLRLMRSRSHIGVVADQVGSPSWARLLAGALWELVLEPRIGGVLHWSDLGVASWYDFAVAIHAEACARGLLDSSRALAIEPIASEDYPTPARRPHYSALDTRAARSLLAAPRMHWREALGAMLDELRAQG